MGATTLAAPAARSIGLSDPTRRRSYGRGETARRIEEERSSSVHARPAVYTAPAGRTRTHSNTSFELPSVPVPLLVLVAIAAMVWMLVIPARSFYAAWREQGALAVRYEVLTQQNEELNHKLERLQSLEGIEDEARRRGYAYPDEEALVVDGIEEEMVADPARVDEAIDAYERGLPWYLHVFDFLFGYEGL